MVKTVNDFGKEMMDAVNRDIMATIHPIMFSKLKGVEVGEFSTHVDGMAEMLEVKLDSTLQKYLGIKIENLPEEQRRDIRGNFKEVFEKAYAEFNKKIQSSEVQALLSPHNELRAEEGKDPLKNLEELVNVANDPGYIRNFSAKSSNASLCTTPHIEVLHHITEGADLSIKKQLSETRELKVPEYQKKMYEIVFEALTNFFKSIGDFFSKGKAQEADHAALVESVDTHVRKELGADITAAEACKKAASAALGEKVVIEGGVHRLDDKTTRDLAARAGVRLEKPAVGKGRSR